MWYIVPWHINMVFCKNQRTLFWAYFNIVSYTNRIWASCLPLNFHPKPIPKPPQRPLLLSLLSFLLRSWAKGMSCQSNRAMECHAVRPFLSFIPAFFLPFLFSHLSQLLVISIFSHFFISRILPCIPADFFRARRAKKPRQDDGFFVEEVRIVLSITLCVVIKIVVMMSSNTTGRTGWCSTAPLQTRQWRTIRWWIGLVGL